MAKRLKSSNPNRQSKYKNVNPGRIRSNKDRKVFKSSHGKFKTVEELEAHKKKNKG